MSDIYNNITGEETITRQPCRVAYTLNNNQPVICTIIGEQPLFYMDHELCYEDEEDTLFDAADFNILESEINTLKQELDRFETFSKTEALSSEEKLQNFISDVGFITGHENSASKADMEALKEILSKSRLASAYLECADQYGVALKFSDQVENASYDRKNAQILINPSINEEDQILLAVKELRRHYQHRQGALINPLTFHPDNSILVHRAQVADLAVSAIRAAWEMQLSGYRAAWERIENSSMADLGRAFAREAFLDFRTINNGQAAAAIFEAWFLSERCRAEDKTLINQMLADHKGYVFDLEQCENSLTPSLIAALGEMPFGKNYLAEHAATIMDDAIFTDVRDRSNANFLWFIKFERTFRETEQELQSSEDQKIAEHSQGTHNINTQGQTHGSQDAQDAHSNAQIIHLPFGSNTEAAEEETGDKSGKSSRRLSPKSRKPRSGSKDDVSNIIYLRRQPGE